MDALSRRIRELRVDSDLTQEEMGTALGITQNMVSNYENGREPSIDTILAYSNHFGVSVEYLFGLTDERMRMTPASEKNFDTMHAAAFGYGDKPFSRSDIAQLAASFVKYYKAGAPAGSVPMACTVAFLGAMTRLLDAATQGDAAAVMIASDDAARAGVDTGHALGAVMGIRPAD